MPDHAVPIVFQNAEGLRLFGILHQPRGGSVRDEVILLLSPGVKMRVAPHRLYNKFAARFVSLGFPVLRFDFHGLGDAEGEAPETHLADLYGETQAGRYVGDTIAAMDWMERTHGYRRFIAAGLCGGALTGLLAADRDPRITALLALAIPVIVDGTNIDASKHMTHTQLRVNRLRYLGKLRLWDPAVWKSWVRLVTLQSHYSLIVRSIAKPLLKRLGREQKPKSAEEQTADNTNPLFAPAFHTFLGTSRSALLVFGETDRLLWDFEVKFLERHRRAIERYANQYEVHIVRQANHIFSLAEWQQEALETSCRWLVRQSTAAPETGT